MTNRAEQLVSFYPSVYSYGPYAQPSYGSTEEAQSQWATEELIKGAKTFFLSEPQQEAATLQSQIDNMQRMADETTVGFARNAILNKINNMKARLAVLQQQSADAAYTTQAIQVAQTATAITSVLAILIAGGVTIYLGTLISNKMKETKLRDLEIKRLQASMV